MSHRKLYTKICVVISHVYLLLLIFAWKCFEGFPNVFQELLKLFDVAKTMVLSTLFTSIDKTKISFGICVKNSNTIAEYVSILLEILSITECNVITSSGLYITSVGYALVLSLNPIFCLSCKCRIVHKKSNMYTGYINIQ